MQLIFGELDFVFVIGLALILAFVGALVLKRIGIPQIVGFMFAGLILGAIGVLTDDVLGQLHFLVSIALGLIGYNIGLEMRMKLFKGRIRKMFIIVLVEAAAAFTVVAFLILQITNNAPLALILGGLASATAPAATADVIWENQCKGPVSDTLMFVLAIDDIIAVILTGATIAFGLWLLAPSIYPFASVIITPLIEVGGSVVFGLLFGGIFIQAVNRVKDRGRLLELELGMIFLLVGIANLLHFSDIFVCIMYGFVVGNYVKKDTEHVPHLLKRIMSPIVMIFFVIVGGKIDLTLFFGGSGVLVAILAATYVVGLVASKYAGTYLGATIARSHPNVRKYLGACLMCQAGVALGLGYVIEETFFSLAESVHTTAPEVAAQATFIGTMILSVVGIGTMVLELVGPLGVKWALGKAGEIPIHGELFTPMDWAAVEDIFDEMSAMYDAYDDEDATTDDIFDSMASMYETGTDDTE